MYAESWELESLRRSLVMCAPEGPATSLTNRDASQLISRVQAVEEELKILRSGVAALLHDTTPVPRANAQLRRFCADLGRLLAASRHAEGHEEGPAAPKSRRVAKMALSCAVWGVSGGFPGSRTRTPCRSWPHSIAQMRRC